MKIFVATIASLLVGIFMATASVGQTDNSAMIESWAATASRAEEVLQTKLASTDALEMLLAELVKQRTEATVLEQDSLIRVDPLKSELSALGPVPEDGTPEATEIANRRAELDAVIADETVPLLIAQAARSRTDKLIREINALIRARFSENLIEVGPTPVDPTIWPPVFRDMAHFGSRLYGELSETFANDASRKELRDKAPVALLLAGLGLWMLLGVRSSFADMVQSALALGGKVTVWQATLAELARLFVPAIGAAAVIFALEQSGLTGVWSGSLVNALPEIAIALIAAPWLGRRVFGASPQSGSDVDAADALALSGFRISVALGVIYAVSVLFDAMALQGDFSRDTQSVLNFPLMIIAGIVFYRLSKTLRAGRMAALETDEKETSIFVFSAIISRALMVFAIAAPILAALGYFALARFLVYPTIQTLGLLAALLVAFDFIRGLLDFWIEGDGHELRRDQTRLLPVLFGFLLAIAALPVIALIWGARTNDLIEIWGWLSNGVSIGESRFSLTDLLVFVLVFGIGYTITRLLQKTIRNSVLPRTKLDVGGKTAVLAGVGYVGVTIAALAAISATGLDLSSLAIVAGALSVGIGFGLQTIVSNFVSGIILLVERPIKEGDWIIAGGHEGIVRKISVRATLVDTFDRCAVVIPNSDLIAGSVLNWTSPDLTGRVKVPIGVAYGTDPERVKEILLDIAANEPLALKYPAPSVVFGNFGASSLDFELRVFIQNVNKILSVRSELNFAIAKRFAEEGIEIPFTQQDITLKNVEQIGQALSGALSRDKS